MATRAPFCGRRRLPALCAGMLLAGTPLPAASACFSAADNARLEFQVFQNAPPPRTRDQAGYDYFPLSAAASMKLQAVRDAAPGYASYYFQWANRSNAELKSAGGKLIARKANLQPSAAGMRKQRSPFSSAARANACTLAQTATVLGMPQRAQAIATAQGIRLASEREQADAPPLGPVDSCVLPTGRLEPGNTGVLLDYEVQDGRTPRETLAFLSQWAQLVHGARRKAILLLNPIDAPTQAYTGISAANIHAVVDQFDLTTIQLWSGNRQGDIAASYQAQKAMIASGGGFDGRRLLISFELAGTTLADAVTVRRIILADRLAGVMFWRNEARQGGECRTDVNAKIDAIAFGGKDTGVVDGPVRGNRQKSVRGAGVVSQEQAWGGAVRRQVRGQSSAGHA